MIYLKFDYNSNYKKIYLFSYLVQNRILKNHFENSTEEEINECSQFLYINFLIVFTLFKYKCYKTVHVLEKKLNGIL